MKIMLVYQTGFANVFAVDHFSVRPEGRGSTRRLLQHAFLPCEYYARGAMAAGAAVRTAACNQAGDIAEAVWTWELSEQPFSKEFNPIESRSR